MQGYVRDMVAAVCVSATGGYGRIRVEDEDALAVVTRFIQCEYREGSGSPLAHVHCAMFKESKSMRDFPRMIFAGVNAVLEVTRNSGEGDAGGAAEAVEIRDLMSQRFPTRDKFRAHFVAKTLFETLYNVLSNLNEGHDEDVVDQWRRAFRFVSDFFPPRNFLGRRAAEPVESKMDVLRVCERFLAVPRLSAADRARGVQQILDVTEGGDRAISIQDLLNVLAELRPLCGNSPDADAEFESLLRQLLVWYVSDKEGGLTPEDSRALLKLLNDGERNVGLVLSLTSKSYVLSQAYRFHQGRLMEDSDAILGDAFSSTPYFPQGHPQRAVAVERTPPLADALYDFLLAVTSTTNQQDLGELAVTAADLDMSTASSAVRSAANVHRLLQRLTEELEAQINGIGMDELIVKPIDEFSIFYIEYQGIGSALRACTDDGGLLTVDFNRNRFIHELLRSRGVTDVRLVLERETASAWAQTVARGLRTETEASVNRPTFMNGPEPQDGSAFKDLHPVFEEFTRVFDQGRRENDFSALRTHILNSFCIEGSIHNMERTQVCKMLTILKLYHEYWSDLEPVRPLRDVLLGIDDLGWNEAEIRVINWLFRGPVRVEDAEGRSNIELIFAESTGDTETFRAFAMNLLALSIGAGVLNHRNVFQMMLFSPRNIQNTWIMGCHGMRWVVSYATPIFLLLLILNHRVQV